MKRLRHLPVGLPAVPCATLYGHSVLVPSDHRGSSMDLLCRRRSFGTEVRELSALLLSLEEALFLQSELHVLDVRTQSTGNLTSDLSPKLHRIRTMAELDDEEVAVPEAEPEEEVTDLMGAVRGVLKKSLMVDGAIRGLHEVAKHIEACKAQVVFLSESCNEATYKKLIQGLCVEKNVPVIDVPDNKSLGEWAGLCKIDKDGMPRKVVGASCVAIVDFGEEGEAYNFMMNLDEIEEASRQVRDSPTLAGEVHTSDTLFLKCCELVREFPSRYLAYRHYRLQGWTVCPDSLKFGADFLLYDGRPDEVHADYALILTTECLQWKDVVMASRLAQLVAKELLLVATNASSSAEAKLAEFLASSTPVLEFATRPWRRHLS
eukprot:s47_g5.t2